MDKEHLDYLRTKYGSDDITYTSAVIAAAKGAQEISAAFIAEDFVVCSSCHSVSKGEWHKKV